MKAHKTAIISPKAEIDDSVEVGPYAIIEDHVKIGAGTKILANAYLTGHTTIGKNNEIHMGAVLGHTPQDTSFDPKTVSYLEIGDENIIREYVTVHRGSKPETKTIIGNNNFLFGTAHLGHNVEIGNHVIVATFVALGGHATVGDNAFIAGGAVVHQFGAIGRLAMVSGNGRFSQNVPPFMTAMERNLIGPVNLVGLERAGLTEKAIRDIKKATRIFFYSKNSQDEALREVEAADLSSPEVGEFVDFIRNSTRPIASHFKRKKEHTNAW